MHITQLIAENFKRIHAVDITPRDNVVEISGKNANGKLSVLDSIWAALGGGTACPAEPVHRGEKTASIVIDMGTLKVTRSWAKSGRTYLTVENADGSKPKSPQTLLDELVGKLSFDPLAFVNEKPAEQRKTLINLLGLDEKLVEIDAKAKAVRAERKAKNDELDRLRDELKKLPEGYERAPDAEIDVAALSQQVEAMLATKAENDKARTEIQSQKEKRESVSKEAHEINDEINRLQAQLQELGEKQMRLFNSVAAMDASIAESEKQIATLVDPDPTPVREQIATANATTKLVAAKQRATAIVAQGNELKAGIATKADEIDSLAESRTSLLTNASYPVAGLAFDDDGLLYNDLPFTQASQAQKIRVGIAMGMAMNPTLKVITVRNGNDLDDDALASLYEMMREHDYQLWIERIRGGESAIVIEDGRVAGVAVESTPQAVLCGATAAADDNNEASNAVAAGADAEAFEL